MDDAELVGAVLAGRTEHFEALVTRYMGLVRGLCASHVRDGAVHDDLVQESFMYAYTRLGSLRDGNRFGSWLCAIVRSKCRDWLRRHRRTEEVQQALSSEPPSAAVSTPEDILMRKELRDWVRAHIAHLPERTREAMFLCYMDGLDQKEAAHFLGIGLSALKKRLQYGRDQLSQRIWRELDKAERPKRDNAKLAGAIMVTLQSAKPPAAAGVLAASAAVLTSKTGVLSLAAAALAVVTIYGLLSLNTTEPGRGIPATVAELSSPQMTVGSPATSPARRAKSLLSALGLGQIIPQKVQPLPTRQRRGITGLVVMKEAGAAIAGVEVELLTYAARRGLEPSDVSITDSDGSFAFPNLDPESQFSLRLGWPHRFTAEPFSRSFGRGPQPDHYVLRARAQGAVTGHVRYPDGTPVDGAKIIREFPFGNTSNLLARSDENGRFGFSHDGGIWGVKTEGSIGLESETVVFDLAGGDIVEHDFTMPRTAAIHLAVTTPDGDPPEWIKGVKVELTLPGLKDNGEPNVRTKHSSSVYLLLREEEEFILPLVGEGRYTITLNVDGFEPATVGPLVIDSSLNDQYAAVTLEPCAVQEPGVNDTKASSQKQAAEVEAVVLKMTVKDGMGNPLQTLGTSLYALDESGRLHQDPISLAQGAYWLAAVKEGYTSDIHSAYVDKHSYELTFVLGEGGTIYGTVLQSWEKELLVYPVDVWEMLGKPAGSQTVEPGFRALGQALAQGAQTDESNAFTLPPLPDGWYVVMSDSVASEPVEVRPGHETGPVDLVSKPEEGTE